MQECVGLALLALQRRVVGLGDLPGLTMEGLYAPAWGAALAQAGLQGAAAQLTKLVAVLAVALEPLATSDLVALGLEGAVELLPLLGAGGLFGSAGGRAQLLHKPFGSWLVAPGRLDTQHLSALHEQLMQLEPESPLARSMLTGFIKATAPAQPSSPGDAWRDRSVGRVFQPAHHERWHPSWPGHHPAAQHMCASLMLCVLVHRALVLLVCSQRAMWLDTRALHLARTNTCRRRKRSWLLFRHDVQASF